MQTNPQQDFSKEDYIKALENLTKLHEAVIAENKTLKAKNESLKDRLADERYRSLTSGFNRDIESLVSARYAFKSGNMNDGMYELEKVLSGADSSWHTRAP